MKNRIGLIGLFVAFHLLSGAQAWSPQFFKGWTKTISQGKFSYHSPQPDVTSSMLLRSNDSTASIEWETEVVPEKFDSKSAHFIWIFGIDADPKSFRYQLYVNGRYALTFKNPLTSTLTPWTVEGVDGVKLHFRTTMLDKYDDPMGYAVLTLPQSWIKKGKPQTIYIKGESAGSNVWYMTFEAAVEEKVDILQEEAILKNRGNPAYSLLFNFVHLGEKVKGKVTIPGLVDQKFELEPGYTRVETLIPISIKDTILEAKIEIDGQPTQLKKVTLHPVKHWYIYLVQHTHTDIGYTRPQTEILPEHLRYIDYALDYCDQTDDLPKEARFRWTCETSWAVKEYLETRPKSQVDRLKKRIQEGRIEVTALFLNSSDLSDEVTVAKSLHYVKQFRDMGIPVNAAMQNDINGVPWCLVDYLSGCGVNFLNMGQNTHRALKPFDRPTTFYWESPSGNRIMVNRPEHYMFGNSLGILTNTQTFGKALFLHLNDLNKKGYPYEQYAIQFSGYLTDNSPPSTTACKLVQEWNEKYEWPQLTLATLSDFANYLQKQHPNDLPVIRGAWPDWWMDGFGSALLETAYTRMAHADFIANDGLMTMARLLHDSLPPAIVQKQKSVSEDILFYDEHTFGAAESISDPLNENSIVQWGEKSAYAWDAVKKNRILREEIFGQIQPFMPKSTFASISLINTLNWPRNGIATVYVDHQLLPKGKSFAIFGHDGYEIPTQVVSSREEGTYWALAVNQLAPFSITNFRIVVSEKVIEQVQKRPFTGNLENDRFRIVINPTSGTISSLFDKKLKREWVDLSSNYKFGQFIYERLGKNRSQLEQLKLGEYNRTSLSQVTVSDVTDGPVWSSVTITGQNGECADPSGIKCEIRLYKQGDQKVELLWSMKKKAVWDPEAVYVAFPLASKNGVFTCEIQGGAMNPGVEQIPGSASDWQGVQNYITLKDGSDQMVFVSPEAPLVQLGDINLGKFARTWKPSSTSLFSWVLNNYWTTNFRAYQEGELKWSYRFVSLSDTFGNRPSQIGWGERIPILSRVFPATKDTLPQNSKRYSCIPSMATFFGNVTQDVLLVDAYPAHDGKGIILQLREVTGKAQTIPVQLPIYSSKADFTSFLKCKSAIEVNVLEEPMGPDLETVTFKPFETKFLRMDLE